MVVLGICLFVVLALGQLAIFVRLSPLQGLQDERTARQWAQERRGDAEATEGAALLRGLRTLHKDQTEIVRRERATSDVLRAQLNAERVALQARCAELDVERLALVDTLSREQRAALAKGQRAQGENPAALGQQEERKRERPTALPATLEGQRSQPFAEGAKPAALAEEQTAGERPTALPTMPGDVADYNELVAATAGGDVDVEDNEQTSLWSSSALTTALEAEAGGATRPPQATPPASAPFASKTLLSMPAQRPAGTSSPSVSAASPPRQEDTRPTFESLPLFDPEPSNAHGAEQEAAQ